MRTVNGWTEKDIQILIARTSRSEEEISRFCRAVDKQLYLLLPGHIRRSTLHFHLGKNSPALLYSSATLEHAALRDSLPADTQDSADNIVYFEKYLRRAGKEPTR